MGGDGGDPLRHHLPDRGQGAQNHPGCMWPRQRWILTFGNAFFSSLTPVSVTFQTRIAGSNNVESRHRIAAVCG